MLIRIEKGIKSYISHYINKFIYVLNKVRDGWLEEPKGTLESLSLRPIEKEKIKYARKLFNEISTENVVYHDVDSYATLLDVMKSL